MRIGVLGTASVGTTLAGKLRELGHDARVGSRDGSKGDGAFADVAAHGELVFNCTAGAASLAALEQAGEDNLRGEVLVDVANPLDFSRGMPPTLSGARHLPVRRRPRGEGARHRHARELRVAA